MSDIDFEELDKAVNTLMGSSTPPAASASHVSDDTQTSMSQPEPAEISATTEVPDVAMVAPLESTQENQPTPLSTVTARSVVPLAAKRRGQFMDMKHPSADMTTQTKSPVASRVGMTLTPSEDIMSDDTSAQNPEELVSGSADANMSVEVEATSESGIERGLSAVLDAPASPFLPDAKVEKRPLGTPAAAVEAPEPGSDELLPQLEGDLDATLDDVTLPSELHPSVLQVESDSTLQADVSDTEIDSRDTESNELVATADQNLSVGDVSSPIASEVEDDILRSKKDAILELSSIPPQYKTKEQPADNDDEHATLYDTTAEHPTVFDTPKKTSRWGVIIMIVGLIALGAGSGVVLYLYQAGSLGF